MQYYLTSLNFLISSWKKSIWRGDPFAKSKSSEKTQQKWPRIAKLPCAIPMEWQSLAFVEEIVEWYTGKKLQGSQLWPILATNFNHPLLENANKFSFGGTNPQTSVFSLKTSKEFLKYYFVVISNCISLALNNSRCLTSLPKSINGVGVENV